MHAKTIIEVQNLQKKFGQTVALNNINLRIRRGQILAIMGPSGSGKSTLLHCVAGIIQADGGKVTYNNQVITAMNDDQRTSLRRREFGFVFQFGQLLPELSAADNVALSLMLSKVPRPKAYQQASQWLKKLGMEKQAAQRPSQLSGGQQQRVAIARAMATSPKILFADEPTGSLDSLNSEKVMELFIKLAREQDMTIIMVTHEPRIAAYCDEEIVVRDGKILQTAS